MRLFRSGSPISNAPPHQPARSTRGAALALFLACAIWGTSFLFGKVGLRELSVSQLLLLRFGLGALVLSPILFRRRTRVSQRDLMRLFLIGILAVPVTFLLQFHGLNWTTVSRASLIIGAGPPLLTLGGVFFFREHPGLRGWGAICASMLGVVLITGAPAGGGSWTGDGLVLLSILVSAIWVLMIKRLNERLPPLITTAYLMLFGTLSLLPITVFGDGLPDLHLSPEVWLSIIVLGVACTALAFGMWNWGLERFPASRAGLFLNIEPVVGVMLGVLVADETLGAGAILGGVLVLGAAWLVSLPKQPDDSIGLDTPEVPATA
jgi:drug/metabolite transporter (DMT)-like permease